MMVYVAFYVEQDAFPSFLGAFGSAEAAMAACRADWNLQYPWLADRLHEWQVLVGDPWWERRADWQAEFGTAGYYIKAFERDRPSEVVE